MASALLIPLTELFFIAVDIQSGFCLKSFFYYNKFSRNFLALANGLFLFYFLLLFNVEKQKFAFFDAAHMR